MNYMTTKTYRPVNVMNDMDRMLNHIFDADKAPSSRGFAADIAEIEDGYRIVANIPGFGAGDVDVRVEENLLVIEAKELTETPETGKKAEADEKITWYVRERRNGTLKRSFILPEDVEKTSVNAEMKNGVITVHLNKKPESKPFSIKVQDK